MNEKEKDKILVVDDEKSNIIALTHILSGDYTIYAAKNGRDAVDIAREHLPTVILLDIIMPEMSGYEVLGELKRDDRTRGIPVIIITGLTNTEDEEQGLTLGAADYITKPFSPMIVKLRVKNQVKILQQMEMIRYLSNIDQLTGISNRRDFDNRLAIEYGHAMRDKKPLALLMIDIDDFKRYNDTLGHLQGDVALKTVAENIDKVVNRSIDFVARWGGEEFTVLLPATDLAGAMRVGESVRKAVEAAQILKSDGTTANVTVSVGVSVMTPDQNNDPNTLVDEADRALYIAKNSGKNIVKSFQY